MALPVKFGRNVDPNTGGLAIARRIAAIADENGLELAGGRRGQAVAQPAFG